MHAQIEGILLSCKGLQAFQRVAGDEVRDIALFSGKPAVPDHVRIEVPDAPAADGVPVCEAVLGRHAVPHMPLA